MMECPVCNQRVQQEERGEELLIWCPACGWGTDQASAAEPAGPVAQTPG